MKAFGIYEAGDHTKITELTNYPKPELDASTSKCLLVKVKGVSLNPVDYKVRKNSDPPGPQGKILGWDAAGTVEQVGADVKGYKVGDEVYYAGDVTKPGSDAEFQLVDERIVGKKPKSVGFAEAAGFPLVSLTAWELLFDSLKVKEGEGSGDAILIVGAAGGVGSMLTQLAKKLTKLTVIATASRPDTIEWVKKMGADHVITHREPLPPQIKELGITPKYVACLNGSDSHFGGVVELIKPRGHIAMIDDPKELDLIKFKPFKSKALTFSAELMFTRSLFDTEDIEEQKVILNRVSEMLDAGTIQSIVTENLGSLDAETLKNAHENQEKGKSIGKNVLSVDF